MRNEVPFWVYFIIGMAAVTFAFVL